VYTVDTLSSIANRMLFMVQGFSDTQTTCSSIADSECMLDGCPFASVSLFLEKCHSARSPFRKSDLGLPIKQPLGFADVETDVLNLSRPNWNEARA
jgi:hypothetical protein